MNNAPFWMCMPLSVTAALSKAFPEGIASYRKVKLGLAKGCYLRIDLAGQLHLLFGVYEAEIAGRLASLVSSMSTCYDIGAAMGYYALAFARLAPGGSVYAFDMDESLCGVLRETLAVNSALGAHVHVFNNVVGRFSDDGGRLVSIDDLVFKRGLKPPDLMKLDVEGAEHDVLLGSSEVLRRFHPSLVIETHSLEVEILCCTLVQALGYDVDVIKRNKLLLEHRPMKHNQWMCATWRSGKS